MDNMASSMVPDDAPPMMSAAVERAHAVNAAPGIVHFGTGRRFRATVAPLVARVLSAGHSDYGVVAISLSDGPTRAALIASGGVYKLIEHKGGKSQSQEIGAIVSLLSARTDRAAVVAAIADRRTQLVSLTVDLDDMFRQAGSPVDDTQLPADPLGLLVAGLAARSAAGHDGLTVLVCENDVGSNQRVASLVDQYTVQRDVQLADWIAMNVRFPAVYCDRLLINDEQVPGDGLDVAVESFCHWVIEDNLGPERAAMEDVGVLLVPDVAPYLAARDRLLDGGLQLIGTIGLLHGHATLDEAFADPAIAALFDRYIDEAVASLPEIKGLQLDRYVAAIRLRIANPVMKLPLGICAGDGSLRLPRSALPTIIAAMREGRDATAAAAMVAAWMVLVTSPDLPDRNAEALWRCIGNAAEDWPQLVAALCDYAPLFGTIGQNQRFRTLIIGAAAHVPGLESLVLDQPAI